MRTRIQEQWKETSPSHHRAKTLTANYVVIDLMELSDAITF
jgi:hypothetical protein